VYVYHCKYLEIKGNVYDEVRKCKILGCSSGMDKKEREANTNSYNIRSSLVRRRYKAEERLIMQY
jgi:hypothetical protein